tara:strand:- start:3196 stop:3891 length:696 start_codon:yes stop_codon:yes gene_type:complete
MPYINTETEKLYDTTQSLSKDFPHTSIPLNTTNDILSINVVYIPLPKIEKYTESKIYSIKHELLDGKWSLFWESKDLPKDVLDDFERNKQEVLNRLIERCDEHDNNKIESNLIDILEKENLEIEGYIKELKPSESIGLIYTLNKVGEIQDEEDSRVFKNKWEIKEEEQDIEYFKEKLTANKKQIGLSKENIKNNTLSVPKEISDYKESLLNLTKKEKWYIDTIFPKTPEEL